MSFVDGRAHTPPRACTVCGKTFKIEDNLFAHLSLVHLRRSDLTLEQRAKSEEQLAEQHGGSRWSCPVCDADEALDIDDSDLLDEEKDERLRGHLIQHLHPATATAPTLPPEQRAAVERALASLGVRNDWDEPRTSEPIATPQAPQSDGGPWRRTWSRWRQHALVNQEAHSVATGYIRRFETWVFDGAVHAVEWTSDTIWIRGFVPDHPLLLGTRKEAWCERVRCIAVQAGELWQSGTRGAFVQWVVDEERLPALEEVLVLPGNGIWGELAGGRSGGWDVSTGEVCELLRGELGGRMGVKVITEG
jgi:hypothetical protein